MIIKVHKDNNVHINMNIDEWQELTSSLSSVLKKTAPSSFDLISPISSQKWEYLNKFLTKLRNLS